MHLSVIERLFYFVFNLMQSAFKNNSRPFLVCVV